MQTEENLVNKDHHATMQIFMKQLRGKPRHRNGRRFNLANAGEKRFDRSV